MDTLKDYAEGFLNIMRRNLKELTQQVKKIGYFKKFALNVVNNITIKLESIDIKAKMQSGNYFGCSLEKLDVRTVDQRLADQDYLEQFTKGKRANLQYKLAEIIGFSVYWLPIVEERNGEEQKINLETVSSEMTDEDEDRVTIMSFDGKAKIVLIDENNIDLESGRINLKLEIGRIDFSIGLDQIEDLIDVVSLLKQYHHKRTLNNEAILHSHFRPQERPSRGKKNVSDWWKYAAKTSLHYSFLAKGR